MLSSVPKVRGQLTHRCFSEGYTRMQGSHSEISNSMQAAFEHLVACDEQVARPGGRGPEHIRMQVVNCIDCRQWCVVNCLPLLWADPALKWYDPFKTHCTVGALLCFAASQSLLCYLTFNRQDRPQQQGAGRPVFHLHPCCQRGQCTSRQCHGARCAACGPAIHQHTSSR